MMTRPLAMVAALLLTFISVSSACFAAGDQPLRFTLDRRSGDTVELRLEQDRSGGHDNFSTSYHVRELTGLSPQALIAPTPAAVSFALIAAAGRIDCAGEGSRGRADGRCGFRQDPAFVALLNRHGYGAPDIDQGVTLTALRFNPEVLDALDRAGYRRGQTKDLAALAIFHIDSDHVRAMSAAGYRAATLGDLVQMKVLGVTPDFVAGFNRAGYRDLAAGSLVQMKLFGITPAFVHAAEARAGHRLSTSDLVQQHMFGPRG